ncbi:arachidonate 5-lipoxygenase-activating protein isoform X2 [Ailuropoda melanoleuca]|uniref:arachidonate 5-lipoxygenase-activating protein isoform X2 n=1 Tax=Ailuropoda melanoleuca TaxID=9646 RepID=UPI001494EE82|nr:arachidonate 5-lipoxygenase-activating protein isoform X2 [Ailuropoda melanoleuca]
MEQAKRFSFCHLPRAWARSVLTPGPPGQPPDCRSALWWRRHCVIWKGGLEVLQWCRVPARRRGQRRVVGRSCCPGGSPWCGRCSPALQTHASVPLDLWERRARRMRRRGSCGEEAEKSVSGRLEQSVAAFEIGRGPQAKACRRSLEAEKGKEAGSWLASPAGLQLCGHTLIAPSETHFGLLTFTRFVLFEATKLVPAAIENACSHPCTFSVPRQNCVDAYPTFLVVLWSAGLLCSQGTGAQVPEGQAVCPNLRIFESRFEPTVPLLLFRAAWVHEAHAILCRRGSEHSRFPPLTPVSSCPV